MKASDNLTYLAEVMVAQAIHVARAELVSRHGEPGGDDAGFAVMAYGKLGGIELGYGSDLDIVFVFSGSEGTTSGPRAIDNVRFLPVWPSAPCMCCRPTWPVADCMRWTCGCDRMAVRVCPV